MAVAGTSCGSSVEFSCWRSFGDLWAEACVPDIAVVAVEMPVGLPGVERRNAPRTTEVHPETSLALLAGAPMRASKRTQAGIEERVTALQSVFPSVGDTVLEPLQGPLRAKLDDLLDAAAAAWTARRIASGDAICLGEGEFDETGYPMQIWV